MLFQNKLKNYFSLGLLVSIAITTLFFSCQNEGINSNTKFIDNSKPNSLFDTNSTFDWVGQIHNEICAHFLQVDSTMSFASSPQALTDSVINYLRSKYPRANYSDFNDFLDSYYITITNKINNNEPLSINPGDSLIHNYYFNLYNKSTIFRANHLLIDSIVGNENYNLSMMTNALNIVILQIDSSNMIEQEKMSLKSQIYIAKYSRMFWGQILNLNIVKKGSISILQTEAERCAMGRDINGRDAEVFTTDITNYASAILAGIGGIKGIAAALAFAALDGTIASCLRWNEILTNHWYNS
jgi:hypothetical protein